MLADPLISERIEKFNAQLSEAIAAVVVADTPLTEDEGNLLGRALAGLSQVSARYWATTDSAVPQQTAIELISLLAWRGIARFPKEK
ncbi:hypothetical protein [Arthrobacter sp. JCM 19049]|uniref:hypothetical protein n=1 Tax=Arthrobacter sp. JCM 19049 TaxID=1460643 RepID=UPI000AA9C0B7|nr:hypothetical protein [Arthrobacter sp. JCM 19049]